LDPFLANLYLTNVYTAHRTIFAAKGFASAVMGR
jgi:hypothetical protein